MFREYVWWCPASSTASYHGSFPETLVISFLPTNFSLLVQGLEYQDPMRISPCPPTDEFNSFFAAVVTQSCLTLSRPHGLYIAHWAPLSMVFPKQEYWSGLPLPSSGDLPHPGIKPKSFSWQADSLSLSHLGSPRQAKTQLVVVRHQLVAARNFSLDFPIQSCLSSWVVVHCTRQALRRARRSETQPLFCSPGLGPGAWLYPSRRVFSLKISKATILLWTWVTAGLRLLKGMIF